MGCLLVGTSQPRSCSCSNSLQQQQQLKLYTIPRLKAFLFSFRFLDSSYYLLFDKLWEREMDGSMDLDYLFQLPTTAKHSNVHTSDFIVARSLTSYLY